jgi:hypothetical protein
MQNLTVHLGSATPLSSRAGPRAPVLSTAPADRPVPPVSGTTARHCAAAHPSAPSLPALSGDHWSLLPTDERHRPTPFALPHRRPTIPVRPCPLLLARHLPRDPLEISGNTLPPSSHHRTAGEHATVLSHTRSAPLGCQAMAQMAFRPTARGRPPCPVGSSLGPVSARYYAGDFNRNP